LTVHSSRDVAGKVNLTNCVVRVLVNGWRILLQQKEMQDREKGKEKRSSGSDRPWSLVLPLVSFDLFSTPSLYRWNNKYGYIPT
jgi:hypothetical protein